MIEMNVLNDENISANVFEKLNKYKNRKMEIEKCVT